MSILVPCSLSLFSHTHTLLGDYKTNGGRRNLKVNPIVLLVFLRKPIAMEKPSLK